MKKYLITSYIPNGEIDFSFFKALKVYAKKNKAELIVTQSKFNYVKDLDTDDELENQKFLGKHLLIGERRLNKALFINGFQQSINVIDPLTGMDAVASHRGSFVLPFPRHRFKSVARIIKNDKHFKGMWCSGSISEPYYKSSIKSGMKMQPYHTKGALIVTVENDDIFHVRQLQWDDSGFYDLNTYYTPRSSKVVKKAVTAFVCGDDHAVFQNKNVMRITKRHIKQLHPSNIVRHDTLDCCSISHHVEGKKLTKALINMTLEEELKLTAKSIKDFEVSFPWAKHFQVASNHPEHLDRYLDEGRYRDDTFNHILALELTLAKARGHNVYKYSMEKFGNVSKTKFLTRKDTVTMCGFEINNHGDAGMNGARGNSKSIGETYSGKVITGHCLTEKHSVNVQGKGFTPIRDVKIGDTVLSFNHKTNTNEWVKVLDTTYNNDYSGTMVKIGYNGLFEQDVTLNHHFFTRDGEYITLQKLLEERKPIDIPTYAEEVLTENVSEEYESLLRLLVAISADGNVSDTNIRFHLKKDRKIKRLRKLLKTLNLRFSENKSKSGSTKITLLKKECELNRVLFEAAKIDKSLQESIFTLSLAEKKIVIDECVMWDGNKGSHGSRQFFSSKRHEAEIINSLANELGYRTSLLVKETGYCVTFNIKRTDPYYISNHQKSNSKFDVIPYEVNNVEVFCITTKYSNFWVRNDENGQVSLTGNTHSPEIGVFNNPVVGTLTDLVLPYTSEAGGSSWGSANVVLYENGTFTHIHILPESKNTL